MTPHKPQIIAKARSRSEQENQDKAMVVVCGLAMLAVIIVMYWKLR